MADQQATGSSSAPTPSADKGKGKAPAAPPQDVEMEDDDDESEEEGDEVRDPPIPSQTVETANPCAHGNGSGAAATTQQQPSQ